MALPQVTLERLASLLPDFDLRYNLLNNEQALFISFSEGYFLLRPFENEYFTIQFILANHYLPSDQKEILEVINDFNLPRETPKIFAQVLNNSEYGEFLEIVLERSYPLRFGMAEVQIRTFLQSSLIHCLELSEAINHNLINFRSILLPAPFINQEAVNSHNSLKVSPYHDSNPTISPIASASSETSTNSNPNPEPTPESTSNPAPNDPSNPLPNDFPQS